MSSRKRIIHRLEPQHLAVLQFLDGYIEDREPLGYVKEATIQNHCRFTPDMKLAPISTRDGKRHGEKIAIGEHLHDLTVQINAKDDPFILVHKSGKHYAISRIGRSMARKCSIAMMSNPYGVKVPTVIETRTGKPPLLASYESAEPIIDEDDEDPIPLPSRAEVQGDGPPIDLDAEDDKPIADEPEGPTDEINGTPASRSQAATRTAPQIKRPPARKPHTKAVAPGVAE